MYHTFSLTQIETSIVCPKRLDPCQMQSSYRYWVKTSWEFSINVYKDIVTEQKPITMRNKRKILLRVPYIFLHLLNEIGHNISNTQYNNKKKLFTMLYNF